MQNRLFQPETNYLPSIKNHKTYTDFLNSFGDYIHQLKNLQNSNNVKKFKNNLKMLEKQLQREEVDFPQKSINLFSSLRGTLQHSGSYSFKEINDFLDKCKALLQEIRKELNYNHGCDYRNKIVEAHNIITKIIMDFSKILNDIVDKENGKEEKASPAADKDAPPKQVIEEQQKVDYGNYSPPAYVPPKAFP